MKEMKYCVCMCVCFGWLTFFKTAHAKKVQVSTMNCRMVFFFFLVILSQQKPKRTTKHLVFGRYMRAHTIHLYNFCWCIRFKCTQLCVMHTSFVWSLYIMQIVEILLYNNCLKTEPSKEWKETKRKEIKSKTMRRHLLDSACEYWPTD